MARIPDEQIERLKQEVSLLRLVERQGITLKKRNYSAQKLKKQLDKVFCYFSVFRGSLRLAL